MAGYRLYIDMPEEEGIDSDGLIAMRGQMTQGRIPRAWLANRELDGKPVRIPGFLLPLEFEGDKVSEFLLVPYVGACIHVPPPPPNQIVHVKTEEAYATDGDLYIPIWVNGLMKTEQSRSSLSLVDGSSNIHSTYTLEAKSIELYE